MSFTFIRENCSILATISKCRKRPDVNYTYVIWIVRSCLLHAQWCCYRIKDNACLSLVVHERLFPFSLLSMTWLRVLSIRPKITVWVFGNFPWRMEQHLPKFPGKRTTLQGIPKIPCDCLPRKFRNFLLNRSLYGNSTISGYSRNFSRKSIYHMYQFQNFWHFWLNAK